MKCPKTALTDASGSLANREKTSTLWKYLKIQFHLFYSNILFFNALKRKEMGGIAFDM
jgi:hypothetical protein